MNKKAIIASLVAVQACALLAADAPATLVSDVKEGKVSNLLESIEPGNMMITDYIRLGVEAEFIGRYREGSTDIYSSKDDFSFDTLDFTLDINISENISFNTVFEYSDDDDDFRVDSAQFDIKLNDYLSLTVGKVYIPFGRFSTDMITDPFTEDFAEICETAAGLTCNLDDTLIFSAWLYQTDIEEEFNNFALTSEFRTADWLTFGVAFVSDIAAGMLQDFDINPNNANYDQTAGINVWFELTPAEKFRFYGEFIGALDNIAAIDETPRVWSFDASYDATDAITVAARYEGASSFGYIPYVSSRFGGAVKYAYNDFITFGVEYMFAEYENIQEDGSHEFAGSVAIEF